MLKWLWSCSARLCCFALLQTSDICLHARCAHSLHSSLACMQRKWPLRHSRTWTLFHRQRFRPQLDLTSFQANKLEETGIMTSPQLSLGTGLVSHPMPKHGDRAEI